MIAYSVVGTGPTVVLLPALPFCHVQLEWQIAENRTFFTALAERLRIVQYDSRGTGLSDRTGDDWSLAAMGRDLEAVVDHLGLDRFALFGFWNSSPVAIAFAADQPDRVAALALWGAFARGESGTGGAQTQALLSLIERDWELFTETAAHLWRGWAPGESSRRHAALFRAAVSQNQALRALAVMTATNVTDFLPLVACPTMLLHRAGRPAELPAVQEIVAAIPSARLALLDGDAVSPYVDDGGVLTQLVTDFFLDPAGTAERAPRVHTSERGAAPPLVLPDAAARLTAREIGVLRLLAQGESNQEIARRLDRSVHTVERHIANIYRKIGARGRADATAFALRNDLA